MVKAVIDVGSNSVLLLVAEKRGSTWGILTDSAEVTALGEGAKSTQALGEPGMVRTLQTLAEYFQVARSLGAQETTAVATMAVRIATNRQEFIERAKLQRTPVMILSGEAESAFGFMSVAEDPSFSELDRFTAIDIGGQSTEIATAEKRAGCWNVLLKRSFPMGTLGLRESFLESESPDRPDRLAACRSIDELIGFRYLSGAAGVGIVLGATGTNLASILRRYPHWDANAVHGAALSFEEVSKAAGWLCSLTDAERAGLEGIEPGREKTIHIGALILERFLFAIGLEQCKVSMRGWRYALLDHPLKPEDLFVPPTCSPN